jgi:hypothetical protein
MTLHKYLSTWEQNKGIGMSVAAALPFACFVLTRLCFQSTATSPHFLLVTFGG